MNHKEYIFTASEITQLEYILSLLPESRVVERIGVNYRLKKARESLAGIPIPPKPKTVNIDFRGEPVVDGVGIDANFAGKAITAFAESTAIAIADSTGDLKDTGALPSRGLAPQLVSEVTTGSFGFQIELPQGTATDGLTGQTFNLAERAVQGIQQLLQTSLEEGDDELAELTSQIHPRAVRKVAELLELLRTNQARVAIDFNGREVALRDETEVYRAASRLAARNITEETITTTGTLIGMVPARGVFEFSMSATGETIAGRIGQDIATPYRDAAVYANTEVTARIRQVQVSRGQPKFTLLEILGPVPDRQFL